MVRSLRRPPVQGSPDPHLPGHVLVPVRKNTAGFPTVNYSVPDTSYWRVNTKTNKPTAVMTVTPDGVSLGWDSCGTCGVGIGACECSSGISLPNSIGYIFVSRGGTKPLPLPNAVVFRQPQPQQKKPKRTLKRVEKPLKKPKRTLLRSKIDKADALEAQRTIDRVYRSLKRN